MAFEEFSRTRLQKILSKWCSSRSPQHICHKLYNDFELTNLSVVLFEVRPKLMKPEEIKRSAYAKTTYVKSRKIWKVFWRRADLKWHRYEPDSECESIEEFLQIVDKDEYGCFFG